MLEASLNRVSKALNQKHDLEEIRKEIRRVTLDIIDLCGKRVQLARQVGEIKAEKGMPIEDSGVEERLKSEVLKLCQARGLDKGFCVQLLKLLLDESKQVQRNISQT
jgi:chorismate mutase